MEKTIARLLENPAHPGLQVHKIRGADGVWEAYVNRGNRVTFEREGDQIVLLNNCNHDIVERH